MMKNNFAAIILFSLFLSCYSFAQEYLVVFASNLESSGGTYREDNSGADLFSVRFNAETKQVTNLTKLTDFSGAAEWFPSISPDLKWVAYNYQIHTFNEVHLLNLETGKDTAIVSDARFPEWINDSELLVSKKQGDRRDIYKVSLDLNGLRPQVYSVERLTDWAKCPNTSFAEDPYPVPGEDKFIFHTIRGSLTRVPAAIGIINEDGSGYSLITEWNGSGHGIVSSNGSKIVCSMAGNGKPVVIDIQKDPVSTSVLPLSTDAAEFSGYDTRFSNVSKVAWTYAAWADSGNSLLLSAQGSSPDNVFSFSRIFNVKFDENWESPEIFDISSEIENLAEKTGRDFCTASARKIPSQNSETSVVYVNIFLGSGNPENSGFPDFSLDENRDEYIKFRRNLVLFCEMIHNHNVVINWMTNWNFLNGVLKWEDFDLMASTNGKNVVRYIAEDLGMSVGPHCHENMGYNYADNCCLIDSLGVTPSDVVGGHISDPDDSHFQNWEKFRHAQQGEMFPHYFWKGNILTLHATYKHVNNPEPSGVWKPKDKNNFYKHDPDANLYAIGQYKSNLPGIVELVNLYKSGAVSKDSMLTGSVNLSQSQLDSQFISSFESNTLAKLLSMRDKGEIKIITFNQVIDIWKSSFDTSGFVYNAPEQTDSRVDDLIIDNFRLEQNSPNPFNSHTTINYTIREESEVCLSVLNMSGRHVRTLEQGRKGAGRYSVSWDMKDDNNLTVGSGVYLYSLKINGNYKQVRKMILIK
ncbi:hypothetical protein DRQ07_03035 [candidate division KSB1 bacterium]|nr:MAG: hypothetical protein DRQ07_03035 [candidate division KSB1 bacterium]